LYEVFGREAEIESEPEEKQYREPLEVEVSGVQPLQAEGWDRNTGPREALEAAYGQAERSDEPETRRDYGKDTQRTNRADNRLARLLQYRRPEGAFETDKRLVEAADTADVLETLEEGTDAM
jgi:hypothetical protein